MSSSFSASGSKPPAKLSLNMPSVHSSICLLLFSLATVVCAVAAHTPGSPFKPSALSHSTDSLAMATGLEALATGNQAFRANIARTDPGLLYNLTLYGQHPQFLYLGCSDSRVSEGTIFNAKPGTLFAQRNVANLFLNTDDGGQAVFDYAIEELKVAHVIVMGHYGCGGVGAAIATPPPPPIDVSTAAIQNWIQPIREIYRHSNRTEIVQLRQENEHLPRVDPPPFNDPGYRALVEENVKTNVNHVAESSVIRNIYSAKSRIVFIHGFVYDTADGRVYNLGVSVGPPGVQIPSIPFPLVSSVHH